MNISHITQAVTAALPVGMEPVEATPDHVLVEFPNARLGVFYFDPGTDRWRFDLVTDEQWDNAEGQLFSVLVSTPAFAAALVREVLVWPETF